MIALRSEYVIKGTTTSWMKTYLLRLTYKAELPVVVEGSEKSFEPAMNNSRINGQKPRKFRTIIYSLPTHSSLSSHIHPPDTHHYTPPASESSHPNKSRRVETPAGLHQLVN